MGMINVNPDMNTARLMERLRYHAQYSMLAEFAIHETGLEAGKREEHLRAMLSRIALQKLQHRVAKLLSITQQRKPTEQEKNELQSLYREIRRYKQ